MHVSMAYGQRGANLHWSVTVLASSTLSAVVSSSPHATLGSGCGTESMSSCVYGCLGFRITWSTDPASTTDPRYMTMMLSHIWYAVVRS